MQSMQICHRDLKLENIMIDNHNNLKFIDLGFARDYESKDFLHTFVGTKMYMAPEIFKENYQGDKADLWALGVILYMIYACLPPFMEANERDPNYHDLITRPKIFWRKKEAKKPSGFFSEDFKDLMTKMLAEKPE